MNSSLNSKRKSSAPYPKLMRDDNSTGKIVVLFTRCREGVVVYSKKEKNLVGCYSNTWHMPAFEDYEGTVELSN